MNKHALDANREKQKELNGYIRRVARCQDELAFSQLFNHFRPQLRAYLLSLDGSSESQVDDLIQIIMLKIWQKAASFNENKAQLSTWVFTMARHCRIDEYRRNKRHRHELTSLPDWPDVETEEIASNPFSYIVMSRLEQTLKASMAQLPEEQHQTMSTIYLKEMTHLETAQFLNLPLGTVKSRLRLGLKKMRPILENTDSE